jgi:choline-sulfatase
MLRDGRYKLIYYVDMPPQLFDLESDPEEAVDLAANGGSREKVSELEAKLRSIVDPEDANHRAMEALRLKVEEFGGTKAILEKRRDFIFSPRHGADWRDG